MFRNLGSVKFMSGTAAVASSVSAQVPLKQFNRKSSRKKLGCCILYFSANASETMQLFHENVHLRELHPLFQCNYL